MSFRIALNNAKLKLEDDAPTIMTAIGCAAVVGSAVLAVRGALKHHEEIMAEHHDMMDAIKLAQTKHKDYTDEDYRRDMAISYGQTVGEFARAYLPSIAAMAIGITLICKGHGMLLSRNAALSSALNALQLAWNKRNEAEKASVETKKVAKDGEIIEVPTASTVRTDSLDSPYSRKFDSNSRNWEPTRDYQRLFLKTQENMANDLLRTRGHIFLNEVYDMLDIPRTPEGALVGWVKTPDNGDGFVSFNITDWRNYPEDEEYIPGVWHLDFNVDGVIYNLI